MHSCAPVSLNEHSSPSYSQAFNKLNVLVAEDNPVNQMVIKEQFSKLGINVTLTTDGVKAVKVATQSEPSFDLIVMDCDMPNLDGHGATQKIRLNEQKQQREPAVIIALSAYTGEEARIKALNSGMNNYLTKPVSIKDLEGLLTEYFVDNKTPLLC